MQAIIEAVSLNKTYKLGSLDVEVLKDINLTIASGEFVSIMGPSGSGKSTLLYLIGGLDKPTSGSVRIKGSELSDRRAHTPRELSGGQQQRVAIARALVNEPDIILADEPIGNLDTRTGIEVMELLQRINREKGKTIVQVTHSREAAAYGNRVINVRDGKVWE